MIKKLIMLFLFFLSNFQIALAEIKIESDKIILENNLLKKVILFSENKPDGIIFQSIFSKQSNKELLNQSAEVPYFEFVINKKLVTSKDKAWQYKDFTTRQMGNGGEEIKLIFEGNANPVNGLQVTIFIQLFPNTSLSVAEINMTTATTSAKLSAPLTEKTCDGNSSTAGSTLRPNAKKKIAEPCSAAARPAANSRGSPTVNMAGLKASRIIPI